MKNLIRSFAFIALMFNGYSSSNTAEPAIAGESNDKKLITPKQRTENLKKEFAKGATEVLKNLQDKKGDGLEVSDPANEYIVCFEQRKVDGKGERFIRIVHPDSAKTTGDVADVTENQAIAPIVKDFFEKVKTTGEAYVPYEISGEKYYASIIDIGFSDPKTEKGHFICVAVSNKDYENDHPKTDDKKIEKKDEEKSQDKTTEDDGKVQPTETKTSPTTVETDKSKQSDNQTKEEKQPATEDSSQKTEEQPKKEKPALEKKEENPVAKKTN